MATCITCLKNILNTSIYCSNKCQAKQNYVNYINDWKNNLVSGNRGVNTKNLSAHIIKYLHEKYFEKCAKCNWNEVNLHTGKVPLEIDHIDGNSENNTESNLVLLCPNCHALTSTYKNNNIGHGREWRRKKYVKIVNVPL